VFCRLPLFKICTPTEEQTTLDLLLRRDAVLFSTRLEIYSVPMFYLLSGITIHLSYSHKLKLNSKGLKVFFSNRIKRLAPLYYLATVLTIVLFRQVPDARTVFTNLTGLFSIYNWDILIVYGGWSLGNELVFYAAFPVLLWLSRHSQPKYIATLIFLFFIYAYFAFFKLDNTRTFISQWKTYINPLNQLFLFGLGTAISSKLRHIKLSGYIAAALILIGIFTIYQYPISGDRSHLITGAPRIIFTIACICIIVGIFKAEFRLPENMHKAIMLIAKSSYSIYLLHPIVYRLVMKTFSIALNHGLSIPFAVQVTVSALATLGISYLAYLKFQLLFLEPQKPKLVVSALS